MKMNCINCEDIYNKILSGQPVGSWTIANAGDGCVILRNIETDQMWERKAQGNNWIECDSVGKGFTSNDLD